MQSTYLRNSKEACVEQMVETTEKSEFTERWYVREGKQSQKTSSSEGLELIF